MDTKPGNLNAKEVAFILRCSRSYVYKMARAGLLGYVALGESGPGHRTAMRFPTEAVAAFIEARTITAGKEVGTGGAKDKEQRTGCRMKR